jgi:hypothetical protein
MKLSVGYQTLRLCPCPCLCLVHFQTHAQLMFISPFFFMFLSYLCNVYALEHEYKLRTVNVNMETEMNRFFNATKYSITLFCQFERQVQFNQI